MEIELLILVLMIFLTGGSKHTICQEHVTSSVVNTEFVRPAEVENPGSEYVHLGIPFQLPDSSSYDLPFQFATSSGVNRLKLFLHRFLNSIFVESQGTPINFILFTDQPSKEVARRILKDVVGRILFKRLVLRGRQGWNLTQEGQHKGQAWNLIQEGQHKGQFPRFRLQFVPISYFENKYRKELDLYADTLCNQKGDAVHPPKNFNASGIPVYESIYDGVTPLLVTCPQKYIKDLFYIQFLLHHELPHSIDRIIILDIDLKFRIDIGDLYEYFELMNRNEVAGLVKNLANNRFRAMAHKDKDITSSMGEEGPYQSISSAVVLLNLEAIRKHPYLFSAKHMAKLKTKYAYTTLADQDAYFLLRYEDPSKIYLLPCQYNFMVHEQDEAMRNPGLSYNTCLDEPRIEHHCGELYSTQKYLNLQAYNHLFKLSTWCWTPSWDHCY